MAKLALAVAIVLPLFSVSLARNVPQDVFNKETETLSLSGGEEHKPEGIRLPSEKPSSFDPRELFSVAETAAARPRVIQIEINFVPVDRHFQQPLPPQKLQIEISFVPDDRHIRYPLPPHMIRIEISFVPDDRHIRYPVPPHMIQIKISFVPVDRHFRHPIPPHVPLGRGCRLLRRGPHGEIARLTAIPRGVNTVASGEHVRGIYAEDKASIPGEEHLLLQPVRAERMGADAEGKGEASVMEPVTETETEPPRELRPLVVKY